MPAPRQLTPKLSVSPQISPEEVQAIAEAGFSTIICNRPDGEVPPGLQAADVAAAAEAAGLAFIVNPVVHSSMTAEVVTRQRAAIEESAGPVLAYCQSGTRCTVLWMLGAAPDTPPAELIQTAARAGYDLAALAPRLQALHEG
ncbi:TIGR01244 family phosphatase [Vannielia litorea]|uniref:TIGR01244 family sulfur transferase n=1 Tax=Vannielia TaxID=2813041 RepID=UPI001C985940|nr:TIGR01244 family sulfur transferase [Vannielia litorea]MBY6046685.1 TIGR01244 family phosphatase [Vannielia litorea]MBY6074099.1 TIGR01244 family phosphatase [Vannielia litorea]MBY6153407.1 TIGR01244 family phosphatase [Vannielia litorea]